MTVASVRTFGPGRPCVLARLLLAGWLWGVCASAFAQVAVADPGAQLKAQRLALLPQLRASTWGEPLLLSSREANNRLEGEVHAELAQGFAEVTAPFKSAAAVCELLFLHLNIRACHAGAPDTVQTLALTIGPKRAQDSDLRHKLNYSMRVEAATPAYFRVVLTSAQGPLGTRDYRIVFEAVPVDARHAFVRLAYSYSSGALARIAVDAYLATVGRGKVGFTVTGLDDAGQPVLLTGERAALERNVARYILALMAHSSVTTGPPRERLEARLRAWFALTERYPQQLRELSLDDYLREKHDDLAAEALSPL